jgi:protein TonB
MRRIMSVVTVCALFGVLLAAQQQVFNPHDEGVTLPAVESQQRPYYTQAAIAAHIEGDVAMQAVVLDDGTVGEVHVTQSLDAETGLDQQAVDALKLWRFNPGTKDGQPVAVRIDVIMTFTLK